MEISELIREEKYKRLIKKALLIRKVEEKLIELYNKGKLNGTIHTCIGQELNAVATCENLSNNDFVVSNHRGHGHFIALTGNIKGLISEIMGKSSGVTGGIGGSQHLCADNFISNGIQGGMTPIAAGIALSKKCNKTNGIVVVFIGDGTLGEGILYETLNLSSVWSCPVLFVLENNGIAQSTSSKQTFRGDIKTRIEGFGIDYYCTNTWDIPDLTEKCSKAVEYVRNNKRPAFLEIKTYRLKAHSKGDDNRDEAEVQYYESIDVINVVKEKFPDLFSNLESEIENIIENVLASCYLDDDLESFHNYEFIENQKVKYQSIPFNSREERINDAIYESIKAAFDINSEMMFIGEDIESRNEFTPKIYGGAFKVSKDLNIKYPGKVRNTPISEAAIVGFATGMSIGGMISIAEIMFGDFLTLAFDQILQHATKFNLMYNIRVPLIIRTPMGGKRGYGPTHSQSIEKYFLGIPGLTMLVLNHRISPRLLYERLFSKVSNPYLVIENKILYTRRINEKKLGGFEILISDEEFPTLCIKPKNKKIQVTIFCYGGILEDVEKAVELAFEEDEILCEIICPSKVCPINIFPILESVRKTGKLLIVEEGCNFAALGSEIISKIVENKIELNCVLRVSNNNIIPSSFKAEMEIIPNAQNIYMNIRRLS